MGKWAVRYSEANGGWWRVYDIETMWHATAIFSDRKKAKDYCEELNRKEKRKE